MLVHLLLRISYPLPFIYLSQSFNIKSILIPNSV